MTNSTRFSLRRFGQVLRLNTAEGYNSALRHYGAAYLFFFIVLAFGKFFIPYSEAYQDAGEKELEILALFFGTKFGKIRLFRHVFPPFGQYRQLFLFGTLLTQRTNATVDVAGLDLGEILCRDLQPHPHCRGVLCPALYCSRRFDGATRRDARCGSSMEHTGVPVYAHLSAIWRCGDAADLAGYGFAAPITPHNLLHRPVEHVSIGRFGFPLQVFCADLCGFNRRFHPLLSALRLGCVHDEGKFQFLLQRSGK